METGNINNNSVNKYSKAEPAKNIQANSTAIPVIHNEVTEINTSDVIASLPANSENTVKPVEKFVDNANNHGLGSIEKHRAEQLTSLFENSTTELQYDYSEALNDGRGITAGRAGFTTGTGDLYEVVKDYTEKSPNNLLAKYLPRLKELVDTPSDSLKGLDGLQEDWTKSAKDPVFKGIQDDVVDKLYYKPAMIVADAIGIKSNLGKAFVYDTIIQHGQGEDNSPDGLMAIIKRTEQKMGGTPKTGVDEKKWLESFIKMRRADLAHAYGEETREVWKDSVGRCDVFSQLAKDGNFDLHGPLKIKTEEYDVTIP